ncbi:HNH endonuclease [Enterobacter sp. BNK-22]|uniref:HNH endonuclease n=1 Tax=Enterobacter sp. BNK-22 TaxID=3376157 RepID=UPI003B506936
MRLCIYCREQKDDKEFSLEHVVPQFLGGAYAPDFLKTRDVCKSCNSNLGLFVDASFEKNWLVTNWLQKASSAFYDKDNPSGVSLVCMGNTELCPPDMPEGHVCEMWLGPQGEQVFLIRPHDERLSSYMGGNPRTMKKIETRAYFLFSENTSQNPIKTWLSFEQAFQGRKVKKILCGEVGGADPASIGFVQADELDNARKQFFTANTEGEHVRNVQTLMYTKFDQRFMCKLAIGIAYCLFGHKVLDSEYGKELHKGLWYREGNEMPKVRGTTLFSQDAAQGVNEIISFPNAVTLMLLSTKEGVAVTLNINSELNWTVLCASNESLTSDDLEKIGEGQILVLVRALQTGIHLDLPSYLAFKLGETSHSGLKNILVQAERSKI